MGRLIDADALIEFLQQKRKTLLGIGGDAYSIKAFDYIIARIEEHPTAYDVEKVVAELGKRKALYNSLWADYRNELAAEYNLGRHDAILGAIEIVKVGGMK